MPWTKAPYVALSLTMVIIIIIMPLQSFKSILSVDMNLYCIALLLEMASFIRLRYTQPDRQRDYRVPLNGLLMCLMFVPMAIITIAAILLAGWIELLYSFGFFVAGIVIILLLRLMRTYRPQWFVVAEGVADVMADTPNSYTQFEDEVE